MLSALWLSFHNLLVLIWLQGIDNIYSIILSLQELEQRSALSLRKLEHWKPLNVVNDEQMIKIKASDWPK